MWAPSAYSTGSGRMEGSRVGKHKPEETGPCHDGEYRHRSARAPVRDLQVWADDGYRAFPGARDCGRATHMCGARLCGRNPGGCARGTHRGPGRARAGIGTPRSCTGVDARNGRGATRGGGELRWMFGGAVAGPCTGHHAPGSSRGSRSPGARAGAGSAHDTPGNDAAGGIARAIHGRLRNFRRTVRQFQRHGAE
jgi:hypothetical protein